MHAFFIIISKVVELTFGSTISLDLNIIEKHYGGRVLKLNIKLQHTLRALFGHINVLTLVGHMKAWLTCYRYISNS